MMAQNLKITDTLKRLADQAGASPSQLSLAWLLSRDPSLVPVPGMKRPTYVRENLGASELSLPADLLRELDALAAAVSGERHNPYNLQFIDD